jgi:hypothetical protein
MAINSVGSSGSDFSQVVSRLMDTVDTNRDGQLSKQEFGTFLTTLLDSLSQTSPTSPNLGTITGASTSRSIQSLSSYAPMVGFDAAKLNDQSHTTPKYQFARAVQDLGLLGAPTSANLQAICDRLNENGMNTKVTGDDTIDFGEGSVDVIFSVGDPWSQWQWIPTS